MNRLCFFNKVVKVARGDSPPFDLASLPPKEQRDVKLILLTLRLQLLTNIVYVIFI